MKNRFIMGIEVLSLVTVPDAEESNATRVETDMAVIEELFVAEFAAANNGDINALMDLRTADATEIMPGEFPLVGHQAIKQAWALQADASEQFNVTSIRQIQLRGDWGCVHFVFDHTTTPSPGGDPVVGDYQVLWIIMRKPGQAWKIHLEMVSEGAGAQ